MVYKHKGCWQQATLFLFDPRPGYYYDLSLHPFLQQLVNQNDDDDA